MLQIEHIAKEYGARAVLDGVTFALDSGRRAGLVGANGVGKSTLLKIVAGEVEPDSGQVRLAAGTTIGYLPQVLTSTAANTVRELIADAQAEQRDLERRMRELETALAAAEAESTPRLLAAYGDVTERFERRGGYDLDQRAEAVLGGLGLDESHLDRPLATLSGGERSRAGLAALLLRAPDLLLLDEPTNHLDFAGMAWLEGYLAAHRGAALVVSHDRLFLNRTVDLVVEIDEHTREGRLYPGDYDHYAAEKARERARREADYAAQQAEIKDLQAALKGQARQVAHNRPARDNDKFVVHYRGERVQQAVSRNVRQVEERLRRLEAARLPRPPEPLHVNPDFDPAALGARVPLSAAGLFHRVGDRVILDGVDLSVYPDSRLVVVGPNGAGKSTLLTLLARRQPPQVGSVSVSPTARIGYLDQDGATLDPRQTLFAACRVGLAGSDEEVTNDLLRHGLFAYDDLGRRVGELSAGQQRKLQLARLIAERANVLLLDEPTNHVSFDVLEEFERALLAFPGPIVAVSHDRRFIERFARDLYELRDGHLLHRPAGPAALLTAERPASRPNAV